MVTVGLVDYGAGNIQSLANAISHLGAQMQLVRTAGDLSSATHVLLPGVGAFGFCAERLRASGLIPSLEQWALVQRRPLLGICVGMQLLADSSEELGKQGGLGWLGGRVEKLQSCDKTVRIPHVGWNTVMFREPFGEFQCGDTSDLYFDHSFAYVRPTRGTVLATCDHGREFCAAVRYENIVGAQFHPEKSQSAGMRFLRSYLKL